MESYSTKRRRIRRQRRLWENRARRRGSTILLVIAILSLLALLAITLSFTSRLEISSASNFSVGIQNRVATYTGVDAVAARLADDLPDGPISPLDLALEPSFLVHRPGPLGDPELIQELYSNASAASDTQRKGERRFDRWVYRPVVVSDTAEVGTSDASARVNVNAADVVTLARLFEAVARQANLNADGEAIARAIVETRFGPDGQPGRANFDDDFDSNRAASYARAFLSADQRTALEGGWATGDENPFEDTREPASVTDTAERDARREARLASIAGTDEADEYQPDLRAPAFGDDVRFAAPRDLLQYPAIRSAGLTPELMAAAEPYLVAFSTSRAQWFANGEVGECLDPNTASAEEIYDALKRLYRDDPREDNLLRQFAVNMVDARDTDNIPTAIAVSGGTGVILGVERTVQMTEVYPDSLTADGEGDDGQFVELFNPWNEEISLVGWQLRIPGAVIPLVGKIAPRGYVVITDDADNSTDSSSVEALPGTGSLYDIFRVVANSTDRRVIVREQLDLPASRGEYTISLHDEKGNMVDAFTYAPDGESVDTLYSFQRENPLVRESRRERANPFGMTTTDRDGRDEATVRLGSYPADGPFVSPVDVLEVFSGYANAKGVAGRRWAFPSLVSPSSSSTEDRELAKRESVLDARLVDLFVIGGPQAAPLDATDDSAIDRSRLEVAREALTAEELNVWGQIEALHPAATLVHGAINVNTASGPVLEALPGLTAKSAKALEERRAEAIRRSQDGSADDGLLFRRPSDVLVDEDVMEGAAGPGEKLRRARAFLSATTLGTESFLLVGQPRVSPDSPQGIQQASRIEALVALDRGLPEYVVWKTLP